MKGIEEIDVDGIVVKVTRKNIKNINLGVGKNGQPFVSAPYVLPDRFIKEFVLSNKDWLKNAVSIYEQRMNTRAQYQEGEARTFLGKEYILHVDTSRKSGYYFRGNDIVICVGENSTPESRKKALANVYREALNEILPELTEKCQNICGLYASEWHLRDMKTRWGSCNVDTKRIWLSVWLVEKPIVCIEAIIYHELAHLKVRGHNKAFYALLESICPSYRHAEMLLKNKL
ncbi:MAG: M48 family metallopeptidase [Clostridia bacterium]|nr:M48 family metallopeptidase [Clostridia bacterium]